MDFEKTESVPNSPLVTVVTAAFNALDGVKTTVASVAEQSFRSVEHIVVDGGSTDGTVAYLRSLGHAVRWISEPDRGIADALNKGVAMARGEYILVLQAEDTFLDAESLARAAPHLRSDTEIVSFGVLMVNGQILRPIFGHGLGRRMSFHMTVPHQGVFCQRAVFDRIGKFDTSLAVAMDYDFFMRARECGARVAVIHEVLSVMPATGISSQLAWKGLRRRMDEFKTVHYRYAHSSVMRAVYHLYWLAYPPFKRVRSALDRRLRERQ
jgi:glycosyltransferase involved in cell wall biosynthesis